MPKRKAAAPKVADMATVQAVIPSTSLNGFWERARRRLKLFGHQWDTRIQPVIVVADSREVGGLPDTYRRFALAFAGSHALGSCTKIRCDHPTGVVLELFKYSWDNFVAVPGLHVRTMTPSAVATDAGVTYAAVDQAFGTLAGSFTDTPDEGRVPFSVAVNGVVTAGRIALEGGRNPFHYGELQLGMWLPFGAAVNLNYAQAATNETFTITGYLT